VNKKRRQLVADSSSDSDDVDDEEEEDEVKEVDENETKLKNNKDLETSDNNKVEVNSEPLDLSKSSDSNKEIKKEEKVETIKTPKRRGRKSKSLQKTITKTQVHRCDYPGCRKTFPNSDSLKEHDNDTHKSSSADGRSRYERRCKGNLYYKI